ncbi:50S ribosomal protein L3 N(5)-glutamine methyltransferase [Marinobacterium sediminicola]|uniref:Ribosomal protein uL3 glutamine methyltransferase n=1 Tax=Marinobacterium sediminicola TaxID=518898 RepID=A0ABY1RVM4_9GAMM|nr:50S ribosomal protein L3 N(5)-glutamine methyltransferase [Marinobacterium sediminicola]ULG70616.1 50S ribosomal protein L3 N(5)-glutamine methyltransferase [Marinobacterium sediminicola]SMR68852.1 [LSU ribosomal protein L3P]-glutamine N5-methyltransferase [Marinobacterium sediminicola]
MKSDQAAISEHLFTLRDYIRWTLSEFNRHQVYFGHGHVSAWDEASQLVLNAVDLPWDTDPAVLDARLTPSERLKVLEYVRLRTEERKPLPYITGEAWFMGLPFHVDERVLIPRSPIAELIAQEFQPWLRPGPVERILDLCTGSGCIGIACAFAFPEAEVDLADISTEALEVARHNIQRHELVDRVRACQGDLFGAVPGERYDLIVSNPPYVDADDLASMPAEYAHEPALALGSGPDGLDITRRILREAADYLSEDGLLVVEVGNSEVHLMSSLPQLPIVWVELEQGGNGVFVVTADELRAHRHLI